MPVLFYSSICFTAVSDLLLLNAIENVEKWEEYECIIYREMKLNNILAIYKRESVSPQIQTISTLHQETVEYNLSFVSDLFKLL